MLLKTSIICTFQWTARSRIPGERTGHGETPFNVSQAKIILLLSSCSRLIKVASANSTVVDGIRHTYCTYPYTQQAIVVFYLCRIEYVKVYLILSMEMQVQAIM
jgi:hypothetical protein